MFLNLWKSKQLRLKLAVGYTAERFVLHETFQDIKILGL